MPSRAELIKEQIKESNRAFTDCVWPLIKDRIGGGEIVPVEGVTTDNMAQRLDTISGIDIWQILPGRVGIVGISNRIQWGRPEWKGYPYHTFTIRHSRPGVDGEPVEEQKKILAIRSGYLYSQLTIQSYLKSREEEVVLLVGIIRTDVLFNAITNYQQAHRILSVEGGNRMRVVDFDFLKRHDYQFTILRWDGDANALVQARHP